jgi:hypothetical protein
VALHHTAMAGALTALRAAVSSTVELVLGCSPNDTFCMEVVGVLVAEFQKLEERCSRLERPVVRICNLLLDPPPGQTRPPDSLRQSWLHGRRRMQSWRL